jgi:type IV pilus assembly protein PilY1
MRRFEGQGRWWVCVALWLAAQAGHAGVVGTVELSPTPLDRSRELSPAVLALSGGVLGTGTLAFMGGYRSNDWSGTLTAVLLHADGRLGDEVWDAGAALSDPQRTPPAGRTLLSARRDAAGDIVGMAFEPAAPFDSEQRRGLLQPSPTSQGDSLEARVDYLRGVRKLEDGDGLRPRGGVLGGMVHAQALYVGYPASRYADAWPWRIHGIGVSAPELAQGAQSHAQFLAQNADRAPMLYVPANDGMLHAFDAPLPTCLKQDKEGRCISYALGRHAGQERWAYVPRATYGNLGPLTQARGFQFQPNVDATPVSGDVFFSQRGRHEWHSLLVGGLRLGGRGVYALDITQPDQVSEAYPERTVLWEFDAAAPAGVSETGEPYNPADLGYTYGQAAIARLANGRWAVLVPGGYFADCSKPDRPARCEQAPAPPGYSPLFVLDAQTGAVIAELKTPAVAGVNSYGLTTPVLGDYDNDQVDDVAFAGDLAGNLWRFDLSAPNPASWQVTLAYRPRVQAAQPITVMPRLFPDPVTNRFMVVFGTGKYLGDGDKHDTSLQAIYGIRDRVDAQGRPLGVDYASLQPQVLREETVTDAKGDSAVLRSLSAKPLPMQAGGWRIDLDVAAGERVVATPAALFDANTVLVSTLLPGGDTPGGALMAIDAATGGPRSIVRFAGGAYAGGQVEHVPSSGMLPMTTLLGGGKRVLPGLQLKASKGLLDAPLSVDAPLWRRRSWSLLTPDS